jgi:hypothetical protein
MGLREDLDIEGPLTQIDVHITDAQSAFNFTGTATMSAAGGKIFELDIAHDQYRRTTVRIRPKRSET